MSSSFSKLSSWLLRKLIMMVVVIAAGFCTYAFWLFGQDADGYASPPVSLAVHREELQAKAATLGKQTADLDAQIAEQKQRIVRAGQVIDTLKKMESVWDRWIWNRAQQHANDEQSARMQVLRKNAEAELVRLRHARVESGRAYNEAEAEFAQADRAVKDQAQGYSMKRHYLCEAWQQGRWYVGMVLAVYLLGPTLVLLGLYYGLAPLVARGRPLRLSEAQAAASTASAGLATVETAVWPGEVLWIKKKFLTGKDDDLLAKTRAVLCWRFPLASIACGLFNLAEVRNVRNAGGRSITLTGATKAALEFTVIEVPEGGSLTVRPGFLAGVLTPAGATLAIRRHWRFLCWQAWVAGQFCFFEFTGPCRLILARHGSLRVEHLVERPEVPMPAARVRQMAVVAFTPNLESRPVRAVSFWRYYTGATKLFDVGFAGAGLVVHTTQGGSADGGSCGVLRRAMKIFGL